MSPKGDLVNLIHALHKEYELSQFNPFKAVIISGSMGHSCQSCQKHMVSLNTAGLEAKLDIPSKTHLIRYVSLSESV